MMKETVRSLRAYFFLAGAYSAFQGWELYVAAQPLGPLGQVFVWIAIVTMVIGAGYLLMTATLPQLLTGAPLIPLGLVALNLLVIIGSYVYLKTQWQVDKLGWTIFGVVFNLYLLVNLRRLSAPLPA